MPRIGQPIGPAGGGIFRPLSPREQAFCRLLPRLLFLEWLRRRLRRECPGCAIAFIQFAKASAASGTLTAAWSPATSAHSFLLAIATADGGVNALTATGPSGYTQHAHGKWSNGNTAQAWLFYKADASASAANPSVSFDNTYQGAALFIAEFSGLNASGLEDKTATSGGTGSGLDSTATAATTVTPELLVMFASQATNATFTTVTKTAGTTTPTLTDWVNPVKDTATVGVVQAGGWSYAMAGTTATYGASIASSAGSNTWVAAVATFKGDNPAGSVAIDEDEGVSYTASTVW